MSTIIGAEALTERDKIYLANADAFEREFIAQGAEEARSIERTLGIAWKLFSALPEEDLKLIREELIRKYHPRYARPSEAEPCASRESQADQDRAHQAQAALALARRIHKIVKDKLSILTMEFLEIAREIVSAKQELLEGTAAGYGALRLAAGYHGWALLEKELFHAECDPEVAAGSRTSPGSGCPRLSSGRSLRRSTRTASSTPRRTSTSAREWEKSLEAIVALAELQRGLDLMGAEINRTKRIVNALEYMVIPELKATIRFLSMKFEERDREEKARLKRVKVLLQRGERERGQAARSGFRAVPGAASCKCSTPTCRPPEATLGPPGRGASARRLP